MTTIRNKFHELGNWHNKISMATIVTREALEGIDLDKMSKEEVSEIIQKVVKDLGRFEGYIIGVDKVVGEIKPFIYAKLGKDVEIVLKGG